LLLLKDRYALFESTLNKHISYKIEKYKLNLYYLKYNDINSVKKCFEDSDNIACVVIEPIAGNMGLIPASEEFLKELRELCDKHGTLLIFDIDRTLPKKVIGDFAHIGEILSGLLEYALLHSKGDEVSIILTSGTSMKKTITFTAPLPIHNIVSLY
jgi:nucleoside-triphosphatase THEP1